MSIFVSKEPVAVSVDGVNTIYIRPKMGYGIEQKVIGEATKFLQATKSQNGSKAPAQTVEVNIGAYNMALLTYNILKWEGPDFIDIATRQPIPCNPENIALLDDNDPLVELVLKEIAERNKGKKEEGYEQEARTVENGYSSKWPLKEEYEPQGIETVMARIIESNAVASPNSRSGGGKSSRASKRMLANTTST